jgi:hypothetical protein
MYDNENTNEETEMNEANSTPAADTLKPQGAPGESKAAMLDTFVQLLGQLGKEDLSNLFNQVQSQYGPNHTPGAVDNSAKNRSTLDMKPSSAQGKGPWKEDLDEMFAGDELNEELKEQIEVVFEAAVNTRVALIEEELIEAVEAKEAELEEAFAQRLEEETSEIFEGLTEKLDQYLDYVVEQWMEENAIALESSLRVDIAENFIESLKGLFTEHYIKVPETKLDIVADLNAEIDSLKETLEELTDKNIQLESIAEDYTKNTILGELTEGLTDLEADKLVSLAEGLEFSDAETYKRKVSILREKCTGTKSKGTGLITEEIVDDEDSTTPTDPTIEAVARAISSRNRF